jgi:hypothetical protein
MEEGVVSESWLQEEEEEEEEGQKATQRRDEAPHTRKGKQLGLTMGPRTVCAVLLEG